MGHTVLENISKITVIIFRTIKHKIQQNENSAWKLAQVLTSSCPSRPHVGLVQHIRVSAQIAMQNAEHIILGLGQ